MDDLATKLDTVLTKLGTFEDQQVNITQRLETLGSSNRTLHIPEQISVAVIRQPATG